MASASTDLLRVLKTRSTPGMIKYKVAWDSLQRATDVPRNHEIIHQWLLEEWSSPLQKQSDESAIIDLEYHELFWSIPGRRPVPISVLHHFFSSAIARVPSVAVIMSITKLANSRISGSAEQWWTTWNHFLAWTARMPSDLEDSVSELMDFMAKRIEFGRMRKDAKNTVDYSTTFAILTSAADRHGALMPALMSATARYIFSWSTQTISASIMGSISDAGLCLLPVLQAEFGILRQRFRMDLYPQPAASAIHFDTYVRGRLVEAAYADIDIISQLLDSRADRADSTRLACWRNIASGGWYDASNPAWSKLLGQVSVQAQTRATEGHCDVFALLAELESLDHLNAALSEDFFELCLSSSGALVPFACEILVRLTDYYAKTNNMSRLIDRFSRLGESSGRSLFGNALTCTEYVEAFVRRAKQAPNHVIWRGVLRWSDEVLSRAKGDDIEALSRFLSAVIYAGLIPADIPALHDVWALIQLQDLSRRDEQILSSVLRVRSAASMSPIPEMESLVNYMIIRSPSERLTVEIIRLLFSRSPVSTTLIQKAFDFLAHRTLKSESLLTELLTSNIALQALERLATDDHLSKFLPVVYQRLVHSPGNAFVWEYPRIAERLSHIVAMKATTQKIMTVPQAFVQVADVIQVAVTREAGWHEAHLWLRSLDVTQIEAVPLRMVLQAFLGEDGYLEPAAFVLKRKLQRFQPSSDSTEIEEMLYGMQHIITRAGESHPLQLVFVTEMLNLIARKTPIPPHLVTILETAHRTARQAVIRMVAQGVDPHRAGMAWINILTLRSSGSSRSGEDDEITDRVLAGLYATPDAGWTPLRLCFVSGIVDHRLAVSHAVAGDTLRRAGLDKPTLTALCDLAPGSIDNLLDAVVPPVFSWQIELLGLLIQSDNGALKVRFKTELSEILAASARLPSGPKLVEAVVKHRVSSMTLDAGLVWCQLPRSDEGVESAALFCVARPDLLASAADLATSFACEAFSMISLSDSASSARALGRVLHSMTQKPSKRKRDAPYFNCARHAPAVLLSYARSCAHPQHCLSPSVRRILAPEITNLYDIGARDGAVIGLAYGLGEGADAEESLWLSGWKGWRRKRYVGQG